MKQDAPAVGWRPILTVVGAVAAGATWIGILGAGILGLRLYRIDVAPVSTVALIPTEHTFVMGLRYLVFPVVLALVGYAVLLAFRPSFPPSDIGTDNPQQESVDSEEVPEVEAGRHGSLRKGSAGGDPDAEARARARNDPGKTPRGLALLLLAYVGFGLVVVRESGLPTHGELGLLVAIVVMAGAAFWLIKRTSGIAEGSVVFLGTILVGTGLCSLVFEYFREPKFDLGAVVRTDGTAVGGFHLASSSASIFMVVPEVPSGKRPTIGNTINPPRPLPATQCDNDPADDENTGDDLIRVLELRQGDCFINVVLAIPRADVRRFTIGPRAVPLSAAGYRAATGLALAALRRRDERGRTEEETKAAEARAKKKSAAGLR